MTADCVVCGADAPVSDACPYCGAACCPEHRTTDDHGCPGTDAGSTDGWRLDLDGTDGGGSDGESTARPFAALLRPGLGLAALALLVVALALGGVAAVGPPGDGLDAERVADGVEAETNQARLNAGAGAAEPDPGLAAVARAHSHDMRDRGFVGHTNPDGEGPGDRVRAAGLSCRPGENVYQTPRGALADGERALAEYVVRAWLGSPGHRRTLLGEHFERQGVGVAVGEEAVYVTQLFC